MKEKAIKEIVVCTVRAPNVSVMILNWSGEVRRALSLCSYLTHLILQPAYVNSPPFLS